MNSNKSQTLYHRLVSRLIVTDPYRAQLCRQNFIKRVEYIDKAKARQSSSKPETDYSDLSDDTKECLKKPIFSLSESFLDDLNLIYKNPETAHFLDAVFSHSPYLFQAALDHADIVIALGKQTPEEVFSCLIDEMQKKAEDCLKEDLFMTHLRVYKVKIHLLIALADLSGVWGLDDVMMAMTKLADCVVNLALSASLFFTLKKSGRDAWSEKARNMARLNLKYWHSISEKSGLFVVALGKCGAGELNYSSDIDLAFFYDKKKWLTLDFKQPERMAVRVTQKFIHLVDTLTPQGYVFRVDIRLRPDAGHKSPVMTVESAETYYETLGQNWERAMLIKARIVAGDIKTGKAFLNRLEPYIWRRSLDYNAISDIHAIMRQIHRIGEYGFIKVSGHNIKLGRGGIREIEFFTQVQQLILGGRYKSLRLAATQPALKVLAQTGFLHKRKSNILINCYCVLRFVENRLQMINDQQTHEIPVQNKEAFAAFCGYSEYRVFKNWLINCFKSVDAIYTELVAHEDSLASPKGSLVFTGVRADIETLKTLEKLGFERPKEAWHLMSGWLGGRVKATQTEKARRILTRLAPRLIEAASKTGQPDIAFAQFADFFSSLSVGISVLTLFLNNPKLMNKVVDILALSPKLAPLLAKKPALLDVMVDPAFSKTLTYRKKESFLKKYMPLLSENIGFEEALNTARRLFNEQQFKIGTHILSAQINPIEAGLAYAREAEAVVTIMSHIARSEVDRLYGFVPANWAIIGFGSLGAEELTAGSDLDLTIVYHPSQDYEPVLQAEIISDPALLTKVLSVQEYFSRVTKRLIAALSAPTQEGILYNVDMQLRPSGLSGPKSVQLSAFKRYYSTKSAWTWEIMALTRARVIVADKSIRQRIRRIIKNALCQRRNPQKIANYIIEIREKLAVQYSNSTIWDLKYRRGGLIDLHFIIEYLQIIHAVDFPFILTPRTDLAIERLFEVGALEQSDYEVLKKAAYFMLNLTQLFQITHHDSYQKLLMTHRFQKLLSSFSHETNPAFIESHLIYLQKQVYCLYKKIIEKATEN